MLIIPPVLSYAPTHPLALTFPFSHVKGGSQYEYSLKFLIAWYTLGVMPQSLSVRSSWEHGSVGWWGGRRWPRMGDFQRRYRYGDGGWTLRTRPPLFIYLRQDLWERLRWTPLYATSRLNFVFFTDYGWNYWILVLLVIRRRTKDNENNYIKKYKEHYVSLQ